MPDMPTIPQYPEQGIQAELDLIYLWNPSVAQELLDELEHVLDDLSPVATSGDYNDLTNKPAIDGVTLTSSTTKDDLGIDFSAYRTAAAQDVIDNALEQAINTKQDIMQVATMPSATQGNIGKVVQYIGTTTANYTNGFFYECTSTSFPRADITQVAGDELTNLTVDATVFGANQMVIDNPTDTYLFFFNSDSQWTWNTNGDMDPVVNLADFGISYEGTPQEGDELSVWYNPNVTVARWVRISVQPETPVGSGVLTLQKNGSTIDTFSANATDNKTINITVPVSAADVSALPASTKYAAGLSLSLDPSTYVLTIQLKDQDSVDIGSAQTVDLPLESIVVSGSYDSTTKSIILVLDNGNTIDIPVGDLVDGLQTEITSQNMLDADLVDDSTSTNKFVTASDKTTWSGKQDELVSGTNIKTVNNTSLLGSGNITIDSLPTQTGNSGKFLTTDGTDASWASVDALPTQTGNSGKFLTTDGSAASWASVDTLPSQTGNSGKFLTTDGMDASWGEATLVTFRTWGANE